MNEHQDDEAIILPSLMSYRDSALHGFVPPSVGTIEAKAVRRRHRRIVTGAAMSVALIGVSTILLVRAAPSHNGPDLVGESRAPASWQEAAARIDGIVNFRDNGPPLSQDHDWAPQRYEQSPPVGGRHNPVWQQCMGNIYDAPIPKEHAVHSLEHGAVWLAYRGDLPADEVQVLRGKIKNRQYTFMSPYAGLDAAVSLQAWGYQLKVDDVNDPRIDAFINVLALNATLEPGAVCSGGNTGTGTAPLTEQQALQRLSVK